MATTKYTRQEFEWIFSLQRVQATMLKGKDSVLSELYGICDNLYQRDLLKDLIIRFNCFDDDIYNLALNEIYSYVTTLNYEPSETAVIALCHDSLADSSQVVLNDLKIYIAKLGVNTFINRFDRLKKYYNRGIRHFIAVDEFIGSGQTVYNRFDEFHKLGLQDVTLDFCIIAGMKEAVVQCRSKGVSLYVSYIMKRGLSDYYSRKALSLYVCEMKKLEEKLADTINQTALTDYNFGYKHSEALYSRINKNVPNNVFPIFWWKKYKNNKSRITLFDRVQNGY